MSKLDEKQVEQAHKSAAVQKDKAFEEWVSQSVLDETAEMVNGLENDPDLDDFEPSEELFQKIVGIANERGLLAEEETAEEETDDVRVKKIEFSDDIVQGKRRKTLENVSTSKGNAIHHLSKKYFVIKWVAMIAVTLLGVFGISMSSQANRTFVMQKVNQLMGNNMVTVINNTNETIKSDTTEEVDRKKAEDVLNIQVPVLFYLPDNVQYKGYEIDEEAQTFLMEYLCENESIFLIAMANPKDASGIYKNDFGKKIDVIGSELSDVNAELWKIDEPEDKKPTYVAQWEYKNTFYEIVGKINEDEMIEIVKNIMY